MLLFVCILFGCSTAELILTSPKHPSERVTSFAVDGAKLIFTYVDLDKASGPNGFLKTVVTNNGSAMEKMYLPTDAEPLISPIAVELDKCYRLWILDSGVQNISGHQNKSFPPVLQAIRLKSNQTVAKYHFNDLKDSKTFFTTMAIDIGSTCDETWVYIADFNSPKLVIFDMSKNSAWKVKHHFFNPDPMSDVPMGLIFNKHKRTDSGIYGLAVTDAYLYFHPFASKNDFRIDKNILRTTNHPFKYDSVSFIGNRDSEAGILRYDESNLIYFYAGFREIGYRFNFFNYTKLDVGVKEGFITDIQVVEKKLWILVNTEKQYYFKTKNIETLARGSFAKSTPILIATFVSCSILVGFHGYKY